MKQQFYRFRSKDDKDYIRITTTIDYDSLDIISDKSNLVNLQGTFRASEGTIAADVIRFENSLNFVISKKMKNLLDQNRITGWGDFPIKIEGIKDDYFIFQNLSKAGHILNLDDVNNYVTENREFDLNTWDGSDIFNLENTLLNVCTERVKDILEKAKITNLNICPL